MSRTDLDPDFEPRVADWLEADPDSAPAAVLGTVLAALPSIPQRRASRVPWRFPPMSSFAKVAVAAVAVVAVGTVGVIALQPGRPGNVGSAPTPTQTPTPTPYAYAGTHSDARAVANGGAIAGPATDRTFTSSIHGISLSYPAGWTHEACHGAVDDRGEALLHRSERRHPRRPLAGDHLFVGVASQPLAGKTGDQWAADFLA